MFSNSQKITRPPASEFILGSSGAKKFSRREWLRLCDNAANGLLTRDEAISQKCIALARPGPIACRIHCVVILFRLRRIERCCSVARTVGARDGWIVRRKDH